MPLPMILLAVETVTLTPDKCVTCSPDGLIVAGFIAAVLAVAFLMTAAQTPVGPGRRHRRRPPAPVQVVCPEPPSLRPLLPPLRAAAVTPQPCDGWHRSNSPTPTPETTGHPLVPITAAAPPAERRASPSDGRERETVAIANKIAAVRIAPPRSMGASSTNTITTIAPPSPNATNPKNPASTLNTLSPVRLPPVTPAGRDPYSRNGSSLGSSVLIGMIPSDLTRRPPQRQSRSNLGVSDGDGGEGQHAAGEQEQPRGRLWNGIQIEARPAGGGAVVDEEVRVDERPGTVEGRVQAAATAGQGLCQSERRQVVNVGVLQLVVGKEVIARQGGGLAPAAKCWPVSIRVTSPVAGSRPVSVVRSSE